MTDREAFLTRWSRRKREASATRQEPDAEQPPPPAPAGGEASEPASGSPAPAPRSEPDRDLPPVDAIDSGTDVRAFLRQGVPQDLARAALRRAWSSDPAIRDFVGLSENSWDFNAPDGVPGFSPFAPDRARELVAQLLGEPKAAPGAEPAVPAAGHPEPAASSGKGSEHEVVNPQEGGGTEAQRVCGVPTTGEPEPRREDTAMQKSTAPEPPSRESRSSGQDR